MDEELYAEFVGDELTISVPSGCESLTISDVVVTNNGNKHVSFRVVYHV